MSKSVKPKATRKLDRLRSWLALAGLSTMIGLLPVMSNFMANRNEVSIQDMVLPILAVIAVAVFLASVFYRFYRHNPLSGFISTILAAFLFTNNYDSRLGQIYPLISALLPLPKLDNIESSVFSAVFIVLLLLLAGWIGKLLSALVDRRTWPAKDIVNAATIAITLTFALLFLPAAKVLITAWPQYFYKPPALNLAGAKSTSNKPDIYYIVLDRYASQSVLANQFNFDNSDFIKFLSSTGYYVNPNAHQNYPYTTQSISSTLNANYDSDVINKFDKSANQTIIPYHSSIQNASVTTALKSLGYQFDQIGTWYEASNKAPLADHFYMKDRQLTLFGQLTYIDSFTQGQLAQSIFWRFLEYGVKIGHFDMASYTGQSQADMTTYALNTLKDLASRPSGGRFIFAHLLIPHDPYFFNADGSISANPNSDNAGEPIKQKYLGQVNYINSQIVPILSQIKQQSAGKAVVVLQADEGPYPIQLSQQVFDQDSANDEINNLDMTQWSDSDLAMKYGNLAAYYLPQAKPADLPTAADNVNIFRLVLNGYFGTTLNYLPECYYAYPKGRSEPLVYKDITDRLTGSANPVCAANGTGAK